MYAHIAVLKIMFLIRTLCLGNDSLYRRFLIIRLNMLRNGANLEDRYVSPALSCWKYVCTYNLNDVVLSFIDNGDSNRILGTKRLVKARVKEIECRRWRYSCMLYEGLSLYLDVVLDMKPIIWWEFAQAQPTYFKKAASVVSILMNGQPKGMQCNFNSDICKLCDARCRDNPRHIMFECEALSNFREPIYQCIIQSMPLPMLQGYIEMTTDGKVKFLL